MSGNSADVVVIGAGHNSLIGAAYLAAAGLEVVVLEEQPHVGGNTVTEELTLPGFRHDSCSSAHVLIQTNPVIRDDELGLTKHGLRYVHTDPAVVLPLADGDAIVMSRDRAATAAELARWNPADGDAYLRLLADWEGGLAAAHARWNAGRLDPAASPDDAAYEALRSRSAHEVIAERFSLRAGARPADLAVLRHDHRRPAGRHRHPAVLDHRRAGRTSAGPRRSAAPGRCPTRWSRVDRVQRRPGARRPAGRAGAGPHTAARSGSSPPTARAGRPAARCCRRRTSPSWPACSTAPRRPPELRTAAATWQPGLTLFAVHLATDANLTYDTPHRPAGRGRRRHRLGGRACTPSWTPSRGARPTRSTRGCSSSARPSSTPTGRRTGRAWSSC